MVEEREAFLDCKLQLFDCSFIVESLKTVEAFFNCQQ